MDNGTPTFICKRCGKLKATIEFHRRPKTKLGHDSVCRICRGMEMHHYNATHQALKASHPNYKMKGKAK